MDWRGSRRGRGSDRPALSIRRRGAGSFAAPADIRAALLARANVSSVVLVCGTAVALCVGAAQPVAFPLALAVVAAVVLAGTAAAFDFVGPAVIVTAILPWLVVTSDVLPRLTVTLAAAAATGLVYLAAHPRGDGSREATLLRIGVVLFFLPIVLSIVRAGGHGPGNTQAAKYVLFPILAFAVAEGTAELRPVRVVALWSSLVAVTVNLLLGITGIANTPYYGNGEILGLGNTKELALLAGCVTAAILAASVSLAVSPFLAIGAIATVATGVRSTLPGLAIAALVRMRAARVRLRIIALIALAVVATFASGAARVIESRIHAGQVNGEYTSFANFGSGRVGIYEVAVSHWWHAGPIDWFIGTGLRTIPVFEAAHYGGAYPGHSDVVEVGVQIGLIGLVGFALIWWVIFVRAKSKLPLLILLPFMALNGVLELGGSLVVGLVLATGVGITLRRQAPEARVEPVRRKLPDGRGLQN